LIKVTSLRHYKVNDSTAWLHLSSINNDHLFHLSFCWLRSTVVERRSFARPAADE